MPPPPVRVVTATTTIDTAIVGAGFAGLAAAVALQRAGRGDFVVLERADELGGTWRDNAYPGAACDVPSYLYSFSFAQRADWSRPCPSQPEVLGYLRDVAVREGVAGRIRLRAAVARAAWQADDARWRLELADGSVVLARALIVACGQLSQPALPDVPGLGDFAGEAFHTARWDRSVDLAGRRVAVVGTGASAAQVVPALQGVASHVHVLQRSASWILPRRNRPYRPRTRRAIARVPGLQRLRRAGLLAACEVATAGLVGVPAIRLALRAWASWHLRRQVADPALRRRLTPAHAIGCKRVLFSSTYLKALQAPDVTLHDGGVAEMTPRGPRTADGQVVDVDVVVYATGFEPGYLTALDVVGRDGLRLAEAWAGEQPAHLGITVAGFPGLFVLYGPNTNVGFGSIVTMLEAQAAHVVACLERADARGAATLELRADRQAAEADALRRRLGRTVWAGCTSWYRQSDDGPVVANWPGTMAEYVLRARRLVAADYDEILPASGEIGAPSVHEPPKRSSRVSG